MSKLQLSKHLTQHFLRIIRWIFDSKVDLNKLIHE